MSAKALHQLCILAKRRCEVPVAKGIGDDWKGWIEGWIAERDSVAINRMFDSLAIL